MGQVLSPKGQDLVTPRIWHSESATDRFLVSPNMHGQTRLDFAANIFRFLLPCVTHILQVQKITVWVIWCGGARDSPNERFFFEDYSVLLASSGSWERRQYIQFPILSVGVKTYLTSRFTKEVQLSKYLISWRRYQTERNQSIIWTGLWKQKQLKKTRPQGLFTNLGKKRLQNAWSDLPIRPGERPRYTETTEFARILKRTYIYIYISFDTVPACLWWSMSAHICPTDTPTRPLDPECHGC